MQDLTVKLISDQFAVYQIILVRASTALLVTLLFFTPLEGGWQRLKTKRPGQHLLRAAALAASNIAFFLSLASLPFPTAVAVFFTVPLMITLLAIPVLGESAKWQKLLLVALGFLGALFVVQPGLAGFQVTALLPLFAALAYAVMALYTRSLAPTESAVSFAVFSQIVLVAVSAGAFVVLGEGTFAKADDPTFQFLLRGWVEPDATGWMILVGVGLLNATAIYLLGYGYSIAEVSRVAPFEYVAIPLSVLWGVLLWSEWPNALAWAGTVLIVGSGLLVAWRNLAADKR